jgi:hypothetical protein
MWDFIWPKLSDEAGSQSPGPGRCQAAGAPEETGPSNPPAFATDAEEDAYWRGVNAGLRMSERAPSTRPAPLDILNFINLSGWTAAPLRR